MPDNLLSYRDDQSQAWLRFWCSIHTESLLSKYLLQAPEIVAPSPALLLRPPGSSLPRVRSAKPPRREPRPPAIARPGRIQEDRTERKARRERRVIQDMPLSDWAKRLIGDGRIGQITLEDILDSIEDYFEVFEGLRKVDPEAYKYFSRVGAPIATRNTMIIESDLEIPKITAAGQLPGFFGCFFPRTKAEYREDILKDNPTFMEFNYFAKSNNYATVAPSGSTIFKHSVLSLERDAFSKEERKRFPWVKGNWGIWWYVGVLPDGEVMALPCRMNHKQILPRGGAVHHSAFKIPPGLSDWQRRAVALDHSEIKRTPLEAAHEYSLRQFAAILAFTSAALSGVQVSIKSGKRTARLGIPIAAARNFFADRDVAEGVRRSPIMHLRLPHERHLQDGRIVHVGEHLAGQRQFSWRGYDISIGAPGLHYASPEGWQEPVRLIYPGDPVPDDMIPISKAAKKFQKRMWRGERPRFQRGEPTSTFHGEKLDPEDRRGDA
jgi:hypothetical protein